jgi:Bacterial pre-peptidase C-terminal domain
MVPATRFNGTVAEGAEVCRPLVVPTGALVVRAQLFNSETQGGAAADLDLEIRNSANTVVGTSGGSTSDELVSLTGLAAGTYQVCVQGFDTVGASATFVLNTWVVGPAVGPQTLRAAGPSNATLGGTASVVASWNVPAGARYLGRVQYSQTAGGAAIGSTTLFVDATANAAALQAAAPVSRDKAVR